MDMVKKRAERTVDLINRNGRRNGDQSKPGTPKDKDLPQQERTQAKTK